MRETKNGLFLVSKQGLREGEEEEGEEEEERGGGNQAKVWILVWIHHFGMIFVHELLGYDC